jgi:Gpi18-like mannosyltransferase
LPDSFLCIVLLIAYFNRNNIKWKNYTLVAAGAMLFLGLCDFSFNIMNGMYTVGLADGIL